MDGKIAHIKKSWLGFDIYISKAYFDGEFISFGFGIVYLQV
jgi:hypothetical protein